MSATYAIAAIPAAIHVARSVLPNEPSRPTNASANCWVVARKRRSVAVHARTRRSVTSICRIPAAIRSMIVGRASIETAAVTGKLLGSQLAIAVRNAKSAAASVSKMGPVRPRNRRNSRNPIPIAQNATNDSGRCKTVTSTRPAAPATKAE